MKKYLRRDFVRHSAGLVALTLSGNAFNYKKSQPKLAFSTIGCPDWSFNKIVDFAQAHKYDGLEIRGIQRNLDLPKHELFNTPARIAETKKLVKDKGIRIINLGASAAMHHGNPTARKKNIDEAKAFIDLAHELDCPFIRVFPNDFPADQDRNTTIDLISKGLLELGNYAKGSDVTVLMESHGKVVNSTDLETIMKAAEHKNVGLVWDIINMWHVTKESPVEVYQKLKKYVRHTHIKDLKMVGDTVQYSLIGKGETPIFEGIDALVKGGYKGYYSFEWEKLWHPEIAEPEVALADFAATMKKHFDKK